MHHAFHVPPTLVMLTGFGILQLFSYSFNLRTRRKQTNEALNVFSSLEKLEWDTLFFFYGVVLAIGGLSYLGYLKFLSTHLYDAYGATTANVVLGGVSAVIDNIPMMVAVLSMDPVMDTHQWLLITLTTG